MATREGGGVGKEVLRRPEREVEGGVLLRRPEETWLQMEIRVNGKPGGRETGDMHHMEGKRVREIWRAPYGGDMHHMEGNRLSAI